jgi:pimeloyl-ACP methyl ester carboxylesterase
MLVDAANVPAAVCDGGGFGHRSSVDLDAIPAPQPPPRSAVWREFAVVRDVAGLLLGVPNLMTQPRGDGAPVLVLPGYGTGDASTSVLRAYLRWLGWNVHGWGLGRNGGDVRQLLPRVLDAIARTAGGTGRRVRLVGWSLGGYLAREAARERPDLVERVVTLGSPVVGGPKYTAVGALYARRGFDLDAIEAAVAERYAVPLCVPVTAIFSRDDGVVAWEACVDRITPGVDHVEVRASHAGLGFSAAVYRVIACHLSRVRDD